MLQPRSKKFAMLKKILRYLGLAVVFAWFFFGGIAHFTAVDFFVAIVPPWVTYPLAAVYVSGVIEVGLALLVLWPVTRPVAGWGLIALTLAVTPANVHMYMNPELFPAAPQSAYLVRLVVQVLLLCLIWWSTRVSSNSPEMPSSLATRWLMRCRCGTPRPGPGSRLKAGRRTASAARCS